MGDLGRPAGSRLGIVCGMESEARALGPWRDDPRISVRISAARVDRAEKVVAELVAEGVAGLLSWGLCGGLDPALAPGDVVQCPPAEILTPDEALSLPDAKARAWVDGWRIVDLESGPVARAGLPCWAIRVVLDEAGFPLPGPALVPLKDNGTPAHGAILMAVAASPATLRPMTALARRHARAMQSLRAATDRIGPILDQLA